MTEDSEKNFQIINNLDLDELAEDVVNEIELVTGEQFDDRLLVKRTVETILDENINTES